MHTFVSLATQRVRESDFIFNLENMLERRSTDRRRVRFLEN
jgi:hypothetical protein